MNEFDVLFAEHQKLLGELQAMRAVAKPKPEQEPVAYLTKRKIGGTEGLLRANMVDRSAKNQETHDFIPLYTAPPKREWANLTAEEIEDIRMEYHVADGVVRAGYERAIEAKLKELNT